MLHPAMTCGLCSVKLYRLLELTDKADTRKSYNVVTRKIERHKTSCLQTHWRYHTAFT